jgi:uncharacterized membrane protein (UPF0182 family)
MIYKLYEPLYRLMLILLGLWLCSDLICHLVAEIFWFREVGYLPAFLLRLTTQLGLWVLVAGVSAAFLIFNLNLAHQLKYPKPQGTKVTAIPQLSPPSPTTTIGLRLFPPNGTKVTAPPQLPPSQTMGLKLFLPIVLVLSLLVGLIVIHYGQVAFSYWHLDLTLASVSPPLPPRFLPSSIWQLVLRLYPQLWQLALTVVFVIVILFQPLFSLSGVAVLMTLSFGFILSGHWAKVLQYFHPTAFNIAEPLFQQDISFYIFTFPIVELLEFWLLGLFLYGLIAVALIYLLSGDSLSMGSFPGFSQLQQRHLHALGGIVMLIIALGNWLRRYELLYSTRGVTYGASYTDVNAELPAYNFLLFLSLAIAGFLLWRAIFWSKTNHRYSRTLIGGLGVYLASVVIVGWLIPVAVQRFVVQPNELTREFPYIQRSIALTRLAFDLEDIDTRTFDPESQLDYETIKLNEQTINNIRLWDSRPLLLTNRQLQRIRLYYEFPNADIDRYTLKAEVNEPDDPPTQKQQVFISARELDYSAVPEQAQTWVNKHLVYTHGYGFTLSPVNVVGPSGLPEYYVKNIGIGVAEGSGGLQVSSERIRQSIPIGTPRIYYGELTNNYVMTQTRVKELDYPRGDENAYNTYDGKGGIALGTGWRKLLFAQYLRDWQMLFTNNFTPQTKLLFRRNINERVRAIAPFLTYDSDPYLVVADANLVPTDPGTPPNYLYWIIDAYTTSNRYPYSDPGDDKFNYIRNSVKVVIDAYQGSVFFYVVDPTDPIINTWNAVFPGMFKPISEMPVTLLSHIRYPVDYFSVQSERLLTYHMTDARVFYNREDQWQIPSEIYGNEQQKVKPYYLILNLPTATQEEFILLLPFTPTQRNNLIGWLAGRSDAENYGKLLLYEFPKQQLVFGPEQIEARINQDPIISQQISLWNRQGSRAVQGNLLVIPIERSLLYVEPLYLEAEQNSLPTFVRVIVAYENRIVMAETLEQALAAIFQPDIPEAPPIIRPIEEPGLE